MLTRSREIEGVKRVDINKDYAVEIICGNAYIASQEALIELATRFDTGRLHSTAQLAEEMMRKNMEVDRRTKGIEIPSVMLFKKMDTRGEENLIGFSTQRVFRVHTVAKGEVPLLYVSNRVFEEEDRGLHLGRFAIQQARVIHDSATWLAHRTGSEVAAYSVEQSGVFVDRKLFPWYMSFKGNPFAQELLTGLWHRVRNNENGSLDINTGVSIAEYKEENKVNILRPNHAPTVEFRRRMIENGMVFERGDAQYVLGKVA